MTKMLAWHRAAGRGYTFRVNRRGILDPLSYDP